MGSDQEDCDYYLWDWKMYVWHLHEKIHTDIKVKKISTKRNIFDYIEEEHVLYKQTSIFYSDKIISQSSGVVIRNLTKTRWSIF